MSSEVRDMIWCFCAPSLLFFGIAFNWLGTISLIATIIFGWIGYLWLRSTYREKMAWIIGRLYWSIKVYDRNPRLFDECKILVKQLSTVDNTILWLSGINRNWLEDISEELKKINLWNMSIDLTLSAGNIGQSQINTVRLNQIIKNSTIPLFDKISKEFDGSSFEINDNDVTWWRKPVENL